MESSFILHENISDLVGKWEGIARRKLISAEQMTECEQKELTERRFVKHGAMCYYNCAQDLKKVLSSLSLSSLTTPEGDQK